jgi:hypothetical protein
MASKVFREKKRAKSRARVQPESVSHKIIFIGESFKQKYDIDNKPIKDSIGRLERNRGANPEIFKKIRFIGESFKLKNEIDNKGLHDTRYFHVNPPEHSPHSDIAKSPSTEIIKPGKDSGIEFLEKIWRDTEYARPHLFEHEANPAPQEQRLQALELAVATIRHFIDKGERPDLRKGALIDERPNNGRKKRKA